jgi:hypothetical protein
MHGDLNATQGLGQALHGTRDEILGDGIGETIGMTG